MLYSRVFVLLLLSALFISSNPGGEQSSPYRSGEGYVKFMSEAPLEIISAESNRLKGIIDTGLERFAFSVEIRSLEGFNSPLQKEHFRENYMEIGEYPTASFQGRFIDALEIPSSGTGEREVRLKGQLNIHGVERERIIPCTLNLSRETIRVRSRFSVLLSDHNIKIPKIVHQKIAEEIRIEVDLTLKRT